MEGVIDHTMRDLLGALGGVDRCVTEFVRVSDRLLPPRVFHRLCPELHSAGRTAAGVPVYVQLLGGQPQPMAENAARAAQLGAPGIDLNFGCPARTVNNSDGGSILLRQPERVYHIVSAVRAAVPAAIPVTVKTRLGFEDSALITDNIQAMQAAGANELAVHARTRRQGYRPPAWWEEIARARQLLDIPVIANGEIWSPADALRCLQVTGCQDLMLGRGVLCRPDLPRLVAAARDGRQLNSLHWPDIPPLLATFFELTAAQYDPAYVGNPIKQWLVYLRSYYPQAALLFEEIKRLREPAAIERHLQQALADSAAQAREPARRAV
jgi:tRNA-dihydrouridine synthase C